MRNKARRTRGNTTLLWLVVFFAVLTGHAPRPIRDPRTDGTHMEVTR